MYLPFIIVIVFSFAVIFFVFWRRLKNPPVLSEENAAAEEKEKQKETKERLLELKLKKKIEALKKFVVARLVFLRFIGSEKKYFLRIFSGQSPLLKLFKREKRGEEAKKIVREEAMSELTRAETLAARMKYDQAEEVYIEILKKNSKDLAAYMGLGRIYAARKDWATAEEAYRYLVKIDPDYLEGHQELARVYQEQKKWPELKSLCEELVNLGYQQSWIWADLGLAHRKSGYPEKAEECYLKAVEIAPDNRDFLDYLLEVSIINKNKTLAEKCFNTLAASENDPLRMQDYRNKIELI